ncbi:SIR2 family protein [uncultured Chryseobacterium sp.]|uniref:SIR2 family NAD-dependent protein deacylase n=1 Tax=uncultured Chryseobacterium sp. TaxID=259322 RepID=UPI0025FF7AF3|nr:SIR2 family protein [uncultured Chryseobacterium sp.]
MSDYLDLSASLYTKTLTLFVGTGFSKYMTDGKAPSWLELLVECTKKVDKKDILLNQLFNFDSSGNPKEAIYDLTICAQILEIEYKKEKKDIKEAIAEIIRNTVNESTINSDKLLLVQNFFENYPDINIITTNYDTLFSDYIISKNSRVIIEGSTMPRINIGQNIYHIHGSILKPDSIVLTLNDYYNFQNNNNYFSRKFYTLLQETTVAILGYSLGDFNLNTILNEVKNTRKQSFRKSDIYYINKSSIPEIISKFYNLTYGIKTIEEQQIDEFFGEISKAYNKGKELIDSANDLLDVINGKSHFVDDFLKLRIALPTILMQASSLGIETNNEDFLNVLLDILNKKKEFTHEDNAWPQYECLADWLIEVASSIEIKDSIIENKFCDLVKYSFKYSSRVKYKGYSWYAWKQWNLKWHEMKIDNQIMLEDLIKNNTWDSDLEIDSIYK